jgi:centromere-localized protein 2
MATDGVEAELQALEEEAEALLTEINTSVGGLSDLRYGKFANAQVKEEVLQGLGGLEAACEKH